MGGLVIEAVRPGVQFVPEAADAFRRADAQVAAEFGRHIDVNSTYRSWSDQMMMFINWGRYVAGKGPYPGHSKAVHPSESFHVQGIALDSDDWRIPRIVEILAENGFIRNRLHVPNENHHFEWLRSHDKNYGKPTTAGGGIRTEVSTESEEDDDMPKNAAICTTANDKPISATNPADIYAIVNTGSGYFSPVMGLSGNPGATDLVRAFEVGGPVTWVTKSHYQRIEADCAAVRTGKS